jgi:tripartite-type tricarboxylate transporter receptor subunit TctC
MARASEWPSRPVNLIVPFPAGGGTDTFARPFSAQFAKTSGKTLVIDNRGGAGGTLGASIAAKSAPDGYNFFMGGTHHVIAPRSTPSSNTIWSATSSRWRCWPACRKSWWSIPRR